MDRMLIKMAMWARNPPPLWKVLLVLGVIVGCFVIVGFEKLVGWPDWLTVNGKVR